MAQVPRDDGWLRYRKHRRATVGEWDAGVTLRETAQIGADSQYNPHLLETDEQVRELELRCYLQGELIRDSINRETRYFQIADTIVGACSGVYTSFVFVECTSGFFHGRPISPKALRRLGVIVND
jgi:hypothetical protein